MRQPWCRAVIRLQVLLLLGVAALDCRAEQRRPWKKRWWASVALMAAVNVADVHSSRGMAETNPLLRNGQGGFQVAKGALVKSAATGGLLLVEALLLKKAPDYRLEKPFTITNSLAAGAVAAVAVRNYRLPRAVPGGLPR